MKRLGALTSSEPHHLRNNMDVPLQLERFSYALHKFLRLVEEVDVNSRMFTSFDFDRSNFSKYCKHLEILDDEYAKLNPFSTLAKSEVTLQQFWNYYRYVPFDELELMFTDLCLQLADLKRSEDVHFALYLPTFSYVRYMSNPVTAAIVAKTSGRLFHYLICDDCEEFSLQSFLSAVDFTVGTPPKRMPKIQILWFHDVVFYSLGDFWKSKVSEMKTLVSSHANVSFDFVSPLLHRDEDFSIVHPFVQGLVRKLSAENVTLTSKNETDLKAVDVSIPYLYSPTFLQTNFISSDYPAFLFKGENPFDRGSKRYELFERLKTTLGWSPLPLIKNCDVAYSGELEMKLKVVEDTMRKGFRCPIDSWTCRVNIHGPGLRSHMSTTVVISTTWPLHRQISGILEKVHLETGKWMDVERIENVTGTVSPLVFPGPPEQFTSLTVYLKHSAVDRSIADLRFAKRQIGVVLYLNDQKVAVERYDMPFGPTEDMVFNLNYMHFGMRIPQNYGLYQVTTDGRNVTYSDEIHAYQNQVFSFFYKRDSLHSVPPIIGEKDLEELGGRRRRRKSRKLRKQ